ncbi:hypothetical protein Malapachy_0949 [Malassezia pachydermatis]|uniref:Uncharacterized protein n=1 Tax=Malassezia pachydermatis TaxID=77020 RepID=A0A0N0RSC3_9BASI|nr:hypothetical protein Malapachy_0949 [Malassezia pachydermatis]KOS14753.1 hypothetical protein Malapachy_0949 [Malassezia pachydermatis]
MDSTKHNVPHLDNVDDASRQKIKNHITVGPYSSKQVSQSAEMTREQPAVVAPELADSRNGPVPEFGQDAQTGPEFVGKEDPANDSLAKKKTLVQKMKGLFKK